MPLLVFPAALVSFDPAQVNVSRKMNLSFMPGICSHLRGVKTPSRGEYLPSLSPVRSRTPQRPKPNNLPPFFLS